MIESGIADNILFLNAVQAAFVEGNPDIVPLPVAATPTASPEALTPATKGKAPMPSVVDEIPVSASPRPSPGTRNTGKRKATVASLEKESDSSTKRRRGPTPTKAKAAPAPAVETAAPKPTKSPRAARAKPSVSVPHSEGWKSAAYKETLREEPQATVLPDSDEEVEEGNGEVAKNSSAAGKNITTSAKFTGDVTFDEGVMVLSEGAPPAAAEQGGSGAVNFKAFRRKGQAHAIGRARIIPYQPEPYYRIASADTEAFLR